MYHFGTTNNDIYEQGVDEGRRQVLADLARIVKDVGNTCHNPDVAMEQLGINTYSYLEQEGYL